MTTKGYASDLVANALSGPPEEYGRKIKTQEIQVCSI